MPYFAVVTNLSPDNINVDRFLNTADKAIAKALGVSRKDVMLTFETPQKKKGDTAQYKSHCDIMSFKELTSYYKSSLDQAASKLRDLLNEWFRIDQHIFTTSYSDHTNKVLVDWTSRRNTIASTPIQDQGKTKFCWAFSFADTTGTTYAIANPSVGQRDFRCSPQDLGDWVYFVQKQKLSEAIEVDDYGSYGCTSEIVIDYVKKQGVSLLRNYKVKIEKKKLKTYIDEAELDREFQAMRKAKGDRIFIKKVDVLNCEASTGILSIDAVFKFLHTGVAFASMYYCKGKGCRTCKGFGAHDGNTVYDEPSHPEDYKYDPFGHGVMVLGLGNKGGKNYLRIRNSHGNRWPRGGPRPGCGDVEIKFFDTLIQLKGVEKKKWNGEEWVSVPV